MQQHFQVGPEFEHGLVALVNISGHRFEDKFLKKWWQISTSRIDFN
jgi:hypothetical protein